ncbi:MAG TPA: hypothetical protein VJY39_05210 [Acidisphaera sp.]|nr:hypothetical protein [Acidisphaera sp.]
MGADDAQRAWVKSVLGVTFAATDEGAARQDGADPARELRDRLARLRTDGQNLQDSQIVAQIASFAARAEAAIDSGRFPRAEQLLGALAQAIADGTETPPTPQAVQTSEHAAEAADTNAPGTATAMTNALESARQRWDGALAEARDGASEQRAELEAYFPEQAEAFERKLDGYWQSLADALNAAQAQDGAADVDQVLWTATELRAQIMADDVFDFLDSNGVPVRPAFTAALDEVDQLLGS